MKATKTASFLLFHFVITFQKRSGFAEVTPQNATLAPTVESMGNPRRYTAAGETVPDEELICESSSSCSSRVHTSTRCQCDHLCLHYGDCCIDAGDYVDNPEKESELDDAEACQSSGVYGSGYYMISRCADTFSDPDIRSLCEQTMPNDEFLNVPVTDKTDKKLFRNLFCAICNGRSIDDMYYWVMTITCTSDEKEEYPLDDSPIGNGASFDTSFVDDGTSFVDDGTSFVDDGTSFVDDGTSFVDDGTSFVDDGTSFGDVGTSFVDDGTSVNGNSTSDADGDIDEDDSEQLRIINDKLKIPSCAKRYVYRLENDDPYRRCTPIEAPVLLDDGQPEISCPLYVAPYLSGNITYRNRECAVSDGADTSHSPCNYPEDTLDPQNVLSFSNLFLFKEGYRLSERSPFRPSPCKEDEMFDPFSKVCRRVLVRYELQDMGSRDENHTQFAVSGETFVQDVGKKCSESDTEGLQAIKEKIASAMSMLIHAEISTFEGQLHIDLITCVESDNGVVFCAEEVPSPSTLCSFDGTLLTYTPDVLTRLEQRSSEPLTHENYRNLSCQTEPLMNIQAFTLTPGVVACSNFSIDANTPSIRFSWNDGLEQTRISYGHGMCVDGVVTPTCDSDYWHYNISSITILNDTHIFLNETRQTFAQGTYLEKTDGFWICIDHLPDQCAIKEESETVEVIVTIIGHTLSLIGLTATILTYVILPRLRNNMGKSILSLVSALFVGQLFQFALWDKTSNASFCTAVAMITHYSFLAAFFWMSVLGYDLSRTFGSRSKMQTVRDSKKTFFYFSLYAWCGPLVIVGISAVFHFGDFEDVTFRYGNVCICWIHDHNALLWAFGVPVVIILVLNFFCFADTVIGILRARIATKRATSSNSSLLNRDGKQDFLLFCKLSCIMGLTWVVSFTAGFVDSKPLTVISIILNSTQGLFIYIAFGCNSRVIEMWRNNYSKRSLTSSRANSMAVTAKTSVSSMTGQQVNQVRIPNCNPSAVPSHQLV